MNKIIYCYNRKYPEYDIEKIPVNYEEYLLCKGHKTLNGIYTNYDINCGCKCKQEYFVSLYSPYENEEIYSHDNTFGSELVFSYNKELIRQWRSEDIELLIYTLNKRLKCLKENIIGGDGIND